MKVLSPVGEATTTVSRLSQRPATVEKKRIGFLHNGKPGGGELLRELGRLLEERYSTATSIFRAKTRPGDGAEFLDDYVRNCDLAVVAVGD